jgi:hypothetical protein
MQFFLEKEPKNLDCCGSTGLARLNGRLDALSKSVSVLFFKKEGLLSITLCPDAPGSKSPMPAQSGRPAHHPFAAE